MVNQYTLLEFNLLVKQVLSEQLERSYWIIAEIGQINRHENGHCYLELVEKDNQFVKAKARGTIWANVYREIHPWFVSQTGTELKQGMKILLNASFEFHEVYGVSLNIKDVDANFTIGERERKKQETLKRLTSEGIIDINRSIELNPVLQRLAIISSATAAGYEDFVNQFENNAYGYRAVLDLYPSVMQGDSAPQSIIDSLHRIYEADQPYDAVVVIRGGGSKMDLDCFDDYELCAHLAQFPLPVITGIGHERDQSIADLVAHSYLKTPTSVAEFLLAKMLDFESAINASFESITLQAKSYISHQNEFINELNFRFKLSISQLIQRNTIEIEQFSDKLKTKPLELIQKAVNTLESYSKLITAYDPKQILKKGYSISRLNGKTIKGQKIEPGNLIETETLNHTIVSTVNEIK